MRCLRFFPGSRRVALASKESVLRGKVMKPREKWLRLSGGALALVASILAEWLSLGSGALVIVASILTADCPSSD